MILTLLFFFGIFVAFLFLIYWIFQESRLRKTGLVIVSTIGILFILVILSTVFEDQLFFKRDARELLQKHQIVLEDNFEIVKNESFFSPGDSYHTFTLLISNNDKKSICKAVRQASNFQIGPASPLLTQAPDEYTGPQLTQNYETAHECVRELLELNGVGYAPTYQIVKIDKERNLLVFEDIVE